MSKLGGQKYWNPLFCKKLEGRIPTAFCTLVYGLKIEISKKQWKKDLECDMIIRVLQNFDVQNH